MEEFYIRRIKRKDKKESLEDLIKEFCYSLGISEKCIKLMILINKKMREKDKISLDEVAKELGVPKTTVSYHIKKFEKIGFIRKNGKYYKFRDHKLQYIIEEIEYDVIKEIKKLKELAKEIDKILDNWQYNDI